MKSWRERLENRTSPDVGRAIDIYETQLELKRQDRVEEKLFNETRLRRGVYGQRYDNGERHDGTRARKIEFPCGGLTKGPSTLWDAPGMQRIKIPFGGLTAEQMETLADLAEEYSIGVCHVTTRQDIQLHYVHIDDTPDLMRRLAAVGITTQEACGNSVRNVTACHLAGVCHGERFDVTAHAHALASFLLGHPDAQDFGRKMKIAFSGCKESACGMVGIHDIGFIASGRAAGGSHERGFEMYVGGGLGAVPHQAKLFDGFVPEAEILPLAQAICRVFARLGEKKNRGRARLKFLVEKLGIEEFRRLVLEERQRLPDDEAWTADLERDTETRHPVREFRGDTASADFTPQPASDPVPDTKWLRSNVHRQRQDGYAVVTVRLPLGDISGWQLRQLAGICRQFASCDARTTIEQNIVLRWVEEAALPALYAALTSVGLAQAGANEIGDITACPGTDTCKLGIASSRGLAAELMHRFATEAAEVDPALRDLRIKISGCFNACGQHHVADLGFYGVSRKIDGATVPHFRVVLGGEWNANGVSYGLTIGAVPSKRVPDFISHITRRYVAERAPGESFHAYGQRIGKKALRQMVDEHAPVPAYSEDSSYYSDWRDPREFTTSDLAKGECAGEVVSRISFDLQAAEREAFEAQVHLENGAYELADVTAYRAMLQAARGLVREELPDVTDDPDAIVGEFTRRFYDSERFHDRYAGGKFAQYLLRRHADRSRRFDEEHARYLVHEAQLFIEAAYACHARSSEPPTKPTPSARPSAPPARLAANT